MADTYVTMLAGRNAWYGRQLASGALSPADGDIVPGKGHIQGPSAVHAFASLMSCATAPLGEDGRDCAAIDILPTLKGLDALLFHGGTIKDFVENMRAESRQDPSERLLSRAVHEGLCFMPTLLVPDTTGDRQDRVKVLKQRNCPMPSVSTKKVPPLPSLAEAFLSDDKLAAIGIDVENMDAFRRNYAAFRAGNAV